MGRSIPHPKGHARIPCPVCAQRFQQKYGVETPQPSEEGERAGPLTLPQALPAKGPLFIHPIHVRPAASQTPEHLKPPVSPARVCKPAAVGGHFVPIRSEPRQGWECSQC